MIIPAPHRIYDFLLILTVGLLPLYIVRISFFGIPSNLFEVLVLVLLLLGVLLKVIRQSWFEAVFGIPRNINIAIALFFLSAFVSTLISHEMRVSFGILKGWVIIPMIFGFFVISAVRKEPEIKQKIVDALIVSGVAVSLVGIAQIGLFTRVRSLYDVPNSLALFIVPILIIALYTGVQLRNMKYLVSALVMFIAVLATQSVGAALAILGTIVIWRYFSRSYEGRKAFVVFALIVAIAISILFLSPRILYLLSPFTHSGITNSATVRLQLWDIGSNLIKKHPILGIGLGQFEPAYQAKLHDLFELSSRGVKATSYKLQAEYVFRDPHNWIISFWLNLGILGLVSFAYINYKAICISIKSKNVENRAIALAGISILLFGLVDTIYWKNDLSVLWWMVLFLSI